MKYLISKLLILGCLALCPACAPFGGSTDLEQRVDEQDIQLRRLEPQQADTWNEVQAMRQEIAQLKGQIAAMNRGEQQTQQPPLDTPLRQADASAQPLNQGAGYEPVTGITPSPRNAPDSSAYATPIIQTPPATAQAAGGSYGLPPESHAEPVSAPTEATWGKADPTPTPQVQVAQKDISLALFDSGVNAYNARNYAEAERSFKDFVKNYPNHTQTAEAQYYLAECQFQRNRFPEAALAYDTVIKKYPKSAQVPGALYKQGVAFSKIAQKDAAKARMQEVISKYPNSPEAARAKSFLKTNK